MKDLISFLAIWFKNFKEHTFKVETGLQKDLKVLSKDLERVNSGLAGLMKGMNTLSEKDYSERLVPLLEKIASLSGREVQFPDINIPDEVRVSNFPTQEYPKSIEISNFPEFPDRDTIKVGNFPKKQEVHGEVSVSGPLKIENIEDITKELRSGLTLKNQISMEEVIKGLQTVVDVINDLRLELPKSLSGAVSPGVSQAAAKKVEYGLNDMDDTSESKVIYLGKESQVGSWLVVKIDTNSGLVKRYAYPSNNKGIAGYSQAWNARLSLTYDTYFEAK